MNKDLAGKIFELLNTGKEGIDYIQNCVDQNAVNQTCLSTLSGFVNLVQSVEQAVMAEQLPNRVKEINANIIFYIGKMHQEIEADFETFLFDFRFHFKSLYLILKYEIAYLLEQYVDKSKYADYYPEIGKVDHQEIIEHGKQAKYKVSIIVLAYNNLKFTRDCVESILENTKGIDYELILVDNASTDATKEYFDSIEGAKVIHLQYNLHVVKGFNIGLMAAEGQYSAAVCNDFIFPQKWLQNLLTCIESDDKIGYVSPAATNISNCQQISISFQSIDEFLQKAETYNNSDPRKWEERVVLLPNVLCCPTALLKHIGYYDTSYFRGEFADDDISFRIRRAGYKLIYCSDTVTHHYGSLTTATDHQSNSIEEGRQTFFKKYNLDAWVDARMDAAYLNLDYSEYSQVKSILGIDVKCGATLLQIKNLLWKEHGIHPRLTAVTDDQKYIEDLKTITGESFVAENITQLPDSFTDQFDLVYIEKSLDCYPDDLNSIFLALSKVIKKKGHLIFKLDNCAGISRIMELLQSSEAVHNKKVYMGNLVCDAARKHGFGDLHLVNIAQNVNEDAKQIIKGISDILTNDSNSNTYLINLLLKATTFYQMVFDCR